MHHLASTAAWLPCWSAFWPSADILLRLPRLALPTPTLQLFQTRGEREGRTNTGRFMTQVQVGPLWKKGILLILLITLAWEGVGRTRTDMFSRRTLGVWEELTTRATTCSTRITLVYTRPLCICAPSLSHPDPVAQTARCCSNPNNPNNPNHPRSRMCSVTQLRTVIGADSG